MNNGKVDWSGSYCAVITPFAQDGRIEEGAFKANIDRLIEEGVDGVVVAGCTGESWALSADERLQLFGMAVDAAAGRVPVIGGTGGIDTGKVAALSRAAREDAGCSGVMILPPYYAVPSRREILAHFEFISREARTPILLYNIPKRTGLNLAPDFLDTLADVEWIAGMKQSSNDFVELEQTLATVGERISVFTGHSAERAVPAVIMGCPGFVSSMESQIMGREAIAMYRLVKETKLDEARLVQMRTLALDKAMRKIGTFPANLKAAMRILGHAAGYVRAPLLNLDEIESEAVRAVLGQLGLLEGRSAAE